VIRHVISLAALLATFAPAHAADSDSRAQAIFAGAKAATGGSAWGRITALRLEERVVAKGLAGRGDSLVTGPSGHFVQHLTLGPEHLTQGVGDAGPWSADTSGETRQLAGVERAEALTDACEAGYGWFWLPRCAGTLRFLGEKTEAGRKFNVLEVRPQDGVPVELWLDRRTRRPDHLVEQRLFGRVVTSISAYRPIAAGVCLPFKRVTRNDRTSERTVARLQVAIANPPVDEAIFAPPRAADLVRFDADADSVTVPIEIRNNHIYVQAGLDGQGPFTLMFDTGATVMIDSALPRRLGIKAVGKQALMGSGEKVERSQLVQLADISLGALHLLNQNAGTIDETTDRAVEDVPADGLIGYEFAKRLTITIDYAGGTMVLARPDRFIPPDGATPLPVTFQWHVPKVDARIDDTPISLVVDTGSRVGLVLTGHFFKASGLAARSTPGHEGIIGWGIGGPALGDLFRAQSLELAGISLPSPVTVVMTGQHEPPFDGVIGGPILRRFIVTLDYPHDRIWLKPNGLPAPGEYDRSGLWLNRAEDGFAVMSINADSPAAKVGFQTGDHVLAVDGQKAGSLELSDLRERLKGPSGTQIRFTLSRDAKPFDLVLTLADLV